MNAVTIPSLQPFVGQHCESTATGNLLRGAGLELSEPMIFGLGQGLAYGVFTFKGMPGPFIGGRPRPEELTQTLDQALGLGVEYRTTRSPKRAWTNVAEFLDQGRPVAAKLNMRLLDYTVSDVDFAGHYVAVVGYDDDTVHVVDTRGAGGRQATSRASFEAARLWKGPMSSSALTWTIPPSSPAVGETIPAAVRHAMTATAQTHLNPPIANFGVKGIRKTARIITGWPQTYGAADLATLGHVMEFGGSGGGLFRPMYAAFLREAALLVGDPRLDDAADQFDEAGTLWTRVATALEHAEAGLDGAAADLSLVADLEEAAMHALLGRA